MNNRWMIFGERSLTLVGASFPDFESAHHAKSLLERRPALDGEVALIGPDDPHAGMKFEPEQAGIWKTAIRSHVVLGLLGALAGAVGAWGLAVADWQAATLSIGYATLFLAVVGGFAGMILAGLLTIRPDHGYVIRRLREALKRRRWAVVVRPLKRSHAPVAMEELRRVGAAPLRSL